MKDSKRARIRSECCMAFLVSLLLFSFAVDVHAVELTYKIQYIKGDAEVKLHNMTDWINATVGMLIPGGTRLSTGFKSQVVVCKQPNGSILNISSLTQLVISRFTFLDAEKKVVTRIDLDKGKVKAKTTTPEDIRNDMKISTPNGHAAVRGTTFSVDQTDSTCFVEAFDGTVEVNSTATGETVQIIGYGNGTGQRATVYNSSDPIYVETLYDMDTSDGGDWDFSQYLLVGGIYVPVNKLALVAPYIGLVSAIMAAQVAITVYVRRAKRKKEGQ